MPKPFVSRRIMFSVSGRLRATKAHERKMLAAARLCADQVERHMGNLDSGHADKAAKAG